jgi:hypothetical protein
MNFNVYLDDVTGQQLISAAERTGETRNALIRQAVAEWLQRHDKPEWPDEVLAFHGVADFPPFESGRDRLDPAAPDPFA